MPKITWVDEKRLRAEISKMKPRDWLYKLLKEELKKKGHWKNKSRKKKFYKMAGVFKIKV